MRLRPCHPLPGALAALLLIAGAAPALAQYSWRDRQGQQHFSDRPPPAEIPDTSVLQRPGARLRAPAAASAPASAPGGAATAVAAAAPPVDPELQARRKRADADAAARNRADDERLAGQRADNCQRARQQLALIASGRRLLRPNAQGETMVADEAARAAEADLARRAIAQDCR